MIIETGIALLDDILEIRKKEIGNDYTGYRNHVYRMVNFCFALRDCTEAERNKIIIAGCFHDIGIWTGKTFDYLAPSILSAQNYLKENNLETWISEISLMIGEHHKLNKYQDADYPLVEIFRQGDLIDFSLGIFKCGLPVNIIKKVKKQFPNAGFHKKLVFLEAKWLLRHPLNPLPVFKW